MRAELRFFGRPKQPRTSRTIQRIRYTTRQTESTAQKEDSGYGGLPYGEEPSPMEDEEDYEEEERTDA